MKPRARSLAWALVTSLICTTAFAQAPDRPSAPTPAPSAAASTAATASPNGSSSALPPGHPPTGDVPAGHPPTGGDDGNDGDDGAGQNPHDGGAGNPHARGAGKGARGQLFDAPPDTSADDPTLPIGTIVLTLRDAEEKPIPATDVNLGILHNTVAAGESREKKLGTSDAEGTVRWDGLAPGSGTSYRASVGSGAALFGTDPFSLGDRVGKRVVLHVYPVTSNIDKALVGTQGLVYLSLREDSITLENLYGIFNLGAVAWVPENETIELPEGYKAFNRPDAMDGVGIDEVNGKGLLRGTIGPGRHDIQYRFQVPLDQDERQTIRLQLPPHVAQMRVMVESSKTMGVEVKGFPDAKKTKNRDGKRVLVTEKMVAREEGGLKVLEITLTGLPTPGPGRLVAAAFGIIALVGGLVYVLDRRQKKGPDEEGRRDLIDAREALLREIVELEKGRRSGEIGPKTYQRVRDALLDALERLVTKIDEATPKKRPPSRVADADDG